MKPSGIVFALFFILSAVQCLKGPVTVADDHPTAPEFAVPVTLSNIDGHLSGTDRVAVIEFYSEMCAVCTSLTWVIDSLYISLADSAFIGANNTDTDTLWKRYSVTSVPTYILFRAGEEVTRLSFAKNEPQVYDSLAALTRQLIAGTLVPDTGDTGTPPDTVPPDYLALDETTFDSTVLREGVTAMVFFLYAGGQPCIFMDSVVRRIAPLFDDRAVISKVHAWKQSGEVSALTDRYGIEFVPQFLFFKDGILQEDAHRTGIIEGDTLIALLDSLLNRAPVNKTVLLDKTTFGSVVTATEGVVMVEFYSPTCSACRTVEPLVAALADTFYTTAVIAKINGPENDSLVKAFEVEGWPTFIFFKNGVEYNRMLGGGSGSFDLLAALIRTGLDGPVGKRRSFSGIPTNSFCSPATLTPSKSLAGGL